jgi:3-deoxy-7-phosphoheptulonate synthase
LKSLTHLPVVADPSHSVGVASLVPSMSLAAIAAGADGLLIEIHPNPSAALSDGPQSLDFETFSGLMGRIRKLASAIGREV